MYTITFISLFRIVKLFSVLNQLAKSTHWICVHLEDFQHISLKLLFYHENTHCFHDVYKIYFFIIKGAQTLYGQSPEIIKLKAVANRIVLIFLFLISLRARRVICINIHILCCFRSKLSP